MKIRAHSGKLTVKAADLHAVVYFDADRTLRVTLDVLNIIKTSQQMSRWAPDPHVRICRSRFNKTSGFGQARSHHLSFFRHNRKKQFGQSFIDFQFPKRGGRRLLRLFYPTGI